VVVQVREPPGQAVCQARGVCAHMGDGTKIKAREANKGLSLIKDLQERGKSLTILPIQGGWSPCSRRHQPTGRVGNGYRLLLEETGEDIHDRMAGIHLQGSFLSWVRSSRAEEYVTRGHPTVPAPEISSSPLNGKIQALNGTFQRGCSALALFNRQNYGVFMFHRHGSPCCLTKECYLRAYP
jgi:hypothetical protein